MQLIDTHVHLNFDTFEPDLAAVRSRWQEAGVVRLVHSCVEPSEFSSIKTLAHQFPELSFAVGLHPLDVEKWHSDTAAEIKSLASSEAKVVAIGEMGMDLYKADNYAEQRIAFEAQLAIACELNLPVIIHCREAAPEVREILQKWRESTGENPRGVMHCWGGTPEETQWFLDLGFYISFSGTVTFKNAKAIQASAAMVTSDRLLVETDCPFLSPVPKRGQKRNEPAYVRYVAEQVAHLRGETLEAIAAQTTQNACALFGLAL
ncbi:MULTISPECIES: TatD family hydrolase [Cyanophyceae]|uniref:TatD family hydrolase n=1 Tax=Cyanophyceae TaxID=3028117 RepID=UPI00232C1132|nr:MULTISPECIES: TatD family hydrolase [Cyanophyceae]MDB9317102.1 TatD family hydrolase [Nodularia spumigena CS-590/01A]MDB9322466.1 TatD family hydrolase [Nodularia spumigena CS-591/07A]MDB9327055.1 TatD family hydrolase [Nodularia spumigena CS-590/02]MDB9329719.1 TatD family hydrolase [Nodularia spumigena CS-591/04]MDB9336169.1 TatD family hydrolase [Nodularia spumigena CS-590/01]